MTTTITLGRYFEAWQRNHRQSDSDLASYLGVAIDQLAALAAEPVEPGGTASLGDADPARPMPMPPASTDLDSIADRHGVNGQRLRNVIYGRI
jgi:hypothetical protein